VTDPPTARNPSGRVIVLGDSDLAALAIVRSLGRAGLEVHLASFEGTPVTRHSRYVAARHLLGHPLRDEARFIGSLVQLLDHDPFDLVIPTSDKSLVPLMAHRAEIDRRSLFVAPTRRGFEVTNRKNETLDLARACGIRVPETLLVEARAGLNVGAVPFAYPLVLKPVVSHSAGRIERNSVRLVRSPDELSQRLPQMLEACPVLVQEFCPGHGLGVSVLASNGTITAAFQHLRVHEPPEGGAGSYRQSVPLTPELLEGVTRFCEALQWDGPAMFEFKQAGQHERPVLMEVNGRFWGSLALAIGAGVDFPRLLYEAAVLGQTTRVFTYRVPYFARHTIRDLRWMYANARTPANRPDLLRVPWSRVAAEAANMVRGREAFDLEWLSDPMPAIAGWSGFAREAAGDVLLRIRRGIRVRKARQRMTRLRRSARLPEQIGRARSILFVCQGNINRSAVAEQALRRSGWGDADSSLLASAGFDLRGGRRSSELSRSVAASLRIDIGDHESTPLTREMLEQFDLIVVMELSHIARIEEIDLKLSRKCITLGVLDPAGGSLDISDPDGKSRSTFEDVYTRVTRCVGELRNSLAARTNYTVGAGADGPSMA